MDVVIVLEWLESIENYFECEGTIEAQKVMFVKSRLKSQALTWWKVVQEERESEGKKPIANWKAMVEKIKKTYLPEDYEIHIYKPRQNLRKKDLDVATYTEEF